MSKKTALITGASSGIGLELAKIHAQHGDNLVIVARNEKALLDLKNELEKQYGISVFAMEKDLAKPNAAQEVYDEVRKHKIKIDYLINNAGFGDFGLFIERDFKKEEEMIQLNITTLTHFTKLYAQDMAKQGGGKIMNVASTAAFQPGPLMAVYFATKAYVLHFSEAVNNELKGTGVTITTFCPGPTKSGFQKMAEFSPTLLSESIKYPTSKEAAEFGYKAMMKNKSVAIHGLRNFILANANRFAPRKFAVAMVRRLQES